MGATCSNRCYVGCCAVEDAEVEVARKADQSRHGDEDLSAIWPAIATAAFSALPWKSSPEAATEWVNVAVHRAWPMASKAIVKQVHEMVKPAIRQALPDFIAGLVSLEKFELGQEAPTITGITVTDLPDGLSVRLYLDVSSGISAKVAVGVLRLGVQKLTFRGQLVVEMRPLLGELPVVGACHLYFLDPPQLDYEFTGAARIAEMATFKQAVRGAVDSVVASQLVMPNSQVMQLAKAEDAPTLASIGFARIPEGVLRVRPVSGKNLADSDWNLSPAETCDAFLRMQLGNHSSTSSTVLGTTNPRWPEGEVHDFVVYDQAQTFAVSVYDKDVFTSDDYLGCISLLEPAAAVQASGQDLSLFKSATRIQTGAVVTAGFARGTLSFRFEWFQPSVELESLAAGALIHSRIGVATLPRGLATDVQVRIRVRERSVESPYRKTPEGQIVADAIATNDLLKLVIRNGKQMGFGDDVIARLTGLRADLVQEVLTQDSLSGCRCGCCPPKAADASSELVVSDKASRAVDTPAVAGTSKVIVAADMNLALTPGDMLEGAVELELVDLEKKVLASVTVPFRDLPFQWPRPGDESFKVYTLSGPGKMMVQVEACLAVAGLAAATLPPRT